MALSKASKKTKAPSQAEKAELEAAADEPIAPTRGGRKLQGVATHKAVCRIVHAGGEAAPGDLVTLGKVDADHLLAQGAVEPLK